MLLYLYGHTAECYQHDYAAGYVVHDHTVQKQQPQDGEIRPEIWST